MNITNRDAFPWIRASENPATPVHEEIARNDVKLCSMRKKDVGFDGYYIVLYWNKWHRDAFLCTGVMRNKKAAEIIYDTVVNHRAYEYACGKPTNDLPPAFWQSVSLVNSLLVETIPEDVKKILLERNEDGITDSLT